MLMVSFMFYIGGLIVFCFNYLYLLNMLLSLEFMMLSLFMIFVIMVGVEVFEFVGYYMVMSVCEASLGLGLLVLGFMVGGNAFYGGLDLLKW